MKKPTEQQILDEVMDTFRVVEGGEWLIKADGEEFDLQVDAKKPHIITRVEDDNGNEVEVRYEISVSLVYPKSNSSRSKLVRRV